MRTFNKSQIDVEMWITEVITGKMRNWGGNKIDRFTHHSLIGKGSYPITRTVLFFGINISSWSFSFSTCFGVADIPSSQAAEEQNKKGTITDQACSHSRRRQLQAPALNSLASFPSLQLSRVMDQSELFTLMDFMVNHNLLSSSVPVWLPLCQTPPFTLCSGIKGAWVSESERIVNYYSCQPI